MSNLRRLVYSPKAFVYVKTDEGIINLSEYVTAGNVSRKVNQVSTAEVTIRNPHRRFTQPGSPTFHPMDRITIFLQRLPGCPVQVFTGYLDSTPYYQMYPGTATLTASCTLKRLQYTFFDPGLPFMTYFLKKYGWLSDGQGGIFKPEEAGTGTVIDERRSSSVSELLFATMKHIGGWQPEEVLVEALPPKLMGRIKEIYNALAAANAEATEDFEEFLKDYLGSSESYGGPVDLAGISLDSLSPGQSLALDAIMSTADVMNASERHRIAAIAAGLTESDLENLDHGDRDSVGIFQMRTGIWNSGKYAGYPDKPTLQARWFFDQARDKDQNQSIGNLCQAVEGSAFPERYATHVANARKLLNQYNAKKQSRDDTPKEENRPYAGEQIKTGGKKDVDTKDNKDTDKDAENRRKLKQPLEVHGAEEGLQVIGRLAQTFGLNVTAGKDDHNTLTASGNVSDHSRGWALDVSNGTAPTDEMDSFNEFAKKKLKPIIKQLIWRNKDQFNGYEIADHMNHVHIAVQEPYATDKQKMLDIVVAALGGRDIGDLVDDPNGTDGTDSTGAGDALRQAKAASLMTTFNFPQAINQAESILLNGDKSLMNDQPLLPFVEELCKGSMRNFMSLPNGAFYAFQPDYFGGFGSNKAYWEISDLEILQGDIRLTDEALATHVYIVGDVFGSGIDLPNKLQTRGIVNLLNAGKADFLNLDPAAAANQSKDKKESDTKPFFGDEQSVLDFLNRYGPRPYVEQATFIRSHVFETFYAFQTFMLMWARQFLTSFTFTFMPELYPGGRVAFPEHGIQCYIDEVQHSFDYSNGFTTQANLSAPSATIEGNEISKGMVRAGVLGTHSGDG